MLKVSQSTSYDGVSLEELTYRDLSVMEDTYGSPWYLTHRVDCHNELKLLACGTEGPGEPAILETASKVASVVSGLL
jgi:salicylate hydroxylase